jgi:hypothetical protein
MTMTGFPNSSVALLASILAVKSVEPPADHGHIMVTGFSGKVGAASPAEEKNTAAIKATEQIIILDTFAFTAILLSKFNETLVLFPVQKIPKETLLGQIIPPFYKKLLSCLFKTSIANP